MAQLLNTAHFLMVLTMLRRKSKIQSTGRLYNHVLGQGYGFRCCICLFNRSVRVVVLGFRFKVRVRTGKS